MMSTIVGWSAFVLLVVLLAMALYDVCQRRHTILHNFPIIGHFRYWLEAIGPELRQYIVTSNNEERPFSRDERSWIYASSKLENNYFGFGSDNDMETSPNYFIVKHSAFPIHSPHPGEPEYDPQHRAPCAKILGGYRQRKHAFRPESIVNISGMSFGSLSGVAIEALNRGAEFARCLQSTGEGGISPFHCCGGDLTWQIGTGYFGCRDLEGNFNLKRLLDTVAKNQHVRAIEIKLSQGAKAGAGGILPKAKITKVIAESRGIPMDRDCISPANHRAFSNVDELLDFVERIADATGLPVGIKSAVGEMEFWEQLVNAMATTGRGVDFVTIDGGEGGTGAGPLAFADHVSLPFKQGFSRVYKAFVQRDLHHHVTFIGSGKLGLPEAALFAFALGCDMINVGREALLAIGCIQAQRCHTNWCPTGIATQNAWLTRGLDPNLKYVRVGNYITTLRKELLALSRACGAEHPALVTADHLEILDDRFGATTVANLFGYPKGYGIPSESDRESINRLMRERRTRG